MRRKIVLLLLIFFQLFCLRELPYSTSLLERTSHKNITQPSPNFSINAMEWDVDFYKSSPELEPFRKYFQTHCQGKSGVSAAMCLTETFEQISYGMTSHEFFFPNYDPVEVFNLHLKGEPGHCTTRAAFLATILLSNGIPARVAQLPDLQHNLVEMWDDGWVKVDPSFRLGNKKDIFWAGTGDYLIYPEPWLYLRVGKRYSYYPFWGKFISLGPWRWQFGPTQTALRVGVLICLLLMSIRKKR